MTTAIDHEAAITTWLADTSVTTAKANYVGSCLLDSTIEVTLRPTSGLRPMLAAFAAIATNDEDAAVNAERRRSTRGWYIELVAATEVEGRRVLLSATFSPGDGDEHTLLDQTLPDWASIPLTPFHLGLLADPTATTVVVGRDGMPTVRTGRATR